MWASCFNDGARGNLERLPWRPHLRRVNRKSSTLLAWAEDRKEIPDYAQGAQVAIPIEIENRGNVTAQKVIFSVIDPERNIVGSANANVALAPNERKSATLAYTAPGKLGIYWVDYSLIDSMET